MNSYFSSDTKNYENEEQPKDSQDQNFNKLYEEVLEDPDYDPNEEYIEYQNEENDDYIETQNDKKYEYTEHQNDENDNQKSLHFQCLQCDSSFSKKMQLNSHVASIHEGKVTYIRFAIIDFLDSALCRLKQPKSITKCFSITPRKVVFI